VQVKATSDGGFIVVGVHFPLFNNVNGSFVRAAKYDAAGVLVNSKIISDVNLTEGRNSYPRMAILENDQVVITYEHGYSTTAGSDVRFRLMDTDLNFIGGENIVPGSVNGVGSFNGLSEATVTELSGGGFVIAFGAGIDGDAAAPNVSWGTSNKPSTKVFYNAAGTPVSYSGSTAADNLYGKDGDDTISGGGGADVIMAGGGNDTVTINASNVTELGTSGNSMLVDGGTGVNLLKLDASANGLTLDLTNVTVSSRLSNFQKIDITGGSGAANTLVLNVSDVLQSNMAVGGAAHVVQIDGDSNDLVNLSQLFDSGTGTGTWSTSSTTTISGTTYNVYSYSGDSSLQVLIDNQIASSNVTLS
jgi:hypothetical protein